MDRERFKALCALYFLNTIQPDELKELKSALDSGDRELQEIFYQTKKTINKLPLSVDLIDRYTDVHQNVPNDLHSKREKKFLFPFFKYHPEIVTIKYNITSAVAILLFLSLLILTFYLYQISSDNSALNNKLINSYSHLDYDSRIFDVLNSKKIEVINLKGQDINPDGYGKIFWSPFSEEAVLQIENLPPIDEMKDYQLWLVKNDSIINEGVIAVNPNSYNFYFFKRLPLNNDDAGYSILLTLEPKGGAGKPTGTIYLKGEINKR